VTIQIVDRIPPQEHWRFRIRPGAWVLVQGGVESYPFDSVLIRAGAPGFMNDPTACAVKNRGPLPLGWYDIEAPVNRPWSFGHYGLPLKPWPGNEMFDRSEFYFHGANALHPEKSSNGCPFTPPGGRWVREQVRNSGINVVQVVAD
jgi:hypothetical protein